MSSTSTPKKIRLKTNPRPQRWSKSFRILAIVIVNRTN